MKLERHESYYLTIIDDTENWSPLGMKAISCLETDKIVVPSAIIFNGERQIIYPTYGLTRVEEDKTFIGDLAEILSLVDNSEFLERNFIVVDREHVFYDEMENTTKFIIAPIVSDESRMKQKQDRDWIMACIDTIMAIKGTDLNLTLDNFDDFIHENRIINSFMKEEKDYHINASELVLRYQGEHGHFALFDSEDVFRIGNCEEVECPITINPSISREHCVITREDDAFYITDCKSRNGTFVNEIKLADSDKVALKNGDIVKLSNMSFTVEIR